MNLGSSVKKTCINRSVFLPVLFFFFSVAGFFSIQPASGDEFPFCDVFRTATSVTIDGVLDEPCWQLAVPVRADYEHGSLGVLCDQPRLIVKYAWDEQYLYIGYETFDTNLLARGTGQIDGPAGNQREACQIWSDSGVDVVEIFLSWGSERYMWDLHHNSAIDFSDVWCIVLPEDDPATLFAGWEYGMRFCRNEYLPDDPPATVAMATRLKPKADDTPSTVNDCSDLDTGYTAEIRIPWLATGIAMNRAVMRPLEGARKQKVRRPGLWNIEGLQLWSLAVVQDADAHRRYHHSGSQFHNSWFHRGASNWPRFVFRIIPE